MAPPSTTRVTPARSCSGSGEECIVAAARFEDDGLARAASVHRLLDARGVELAFVGVGDLVAVDGELRAEGGAGRRNDRLGDLAGVLGMEYGGQEEEN